MTIQIKYQAIAHVLHEVISIDQNGEEKDFEVVELSNSGVILIPPDSLNVSPIMFEQINEQELIEKLQTTWNLSEEDAILWVEAFTYTSEILNLKEFIV